VGIRSCPAVVSQLQRAKATQDAEKRNLIIEDVREKVRVSNLSCLTSSWRMVQV
jgi:hypothetical protein